MYKDAWHVCSVTNVMAHCSRNQLWNCTHFRHPTDEQLGHVDIFFSNYYNLQSVYFEFKLNCIILQM